MSRLGKQAKDIFSSTTPGNPAQPSSPESQADNLPALKAQRERVTFNLFNKAVVIKESSQNFEVRPPLRETTALRAVAGQPAAAGAAPVARPVQANNTSTCRETVAPANPLASVPARQVPETNTQPAQVKYFPPEPATTQKQEHAAEPGQAKDASGAVKVALPEPPVERVSAAEILRGAEVRPRAPIRNAAPYERKPSVWGPLFRRIFSIEAALLLIAVAVQVAVLYSFKK